MKKDLSKINSALEKLKKLPSIDSLLKDDIFSISNYPHYERVLSNWFAYYIDSTKKKTTSALFAEVFARVLEKKQIHSKSNFEWLNNEIKCKTEEYTNEKNFIDLVVYDFENEDGLYTNALVIEHKVFADVYNNLDDYFESVKCEEEKVGIVLSALPSNFSNKNFINVTYTEFLSAFQECFGNYLTALDSKEIFYLKEFTNNLKRMSNQENKEIFEFAFKHGHEIAKIAEYKNGVENEFINVIKARELNEGIMFHRKNPKSISFSAKGGNLVIYAEVREILWNKKCPVQIWLQNDLANNWKNLTDYSEIKNDYPGYAFQNNKHGEKWVEIFRDEYTFTLEQFNIDSLIQDFYHNLKQSFDEMNKLVDFISKQN